MGRRKRSGVTKTPLSSPEVGQPGFEGLMWGANDLRARPIYLGENPKAQAEEDYGPSSAKSPLGIAEGSSVLGRPTVPPKGRVKTV